MHTESTLQRSDASFWQQLSEQIDSGDYNFEGFVFPGNAIFGDRQFGAHANFAKCVFEGRAAFNDTAFLGGATWRSCRFEGEVTFDRVSCGAGTSFRGARFQGPVSFIHFAVDGVTDFASARFADNSSWLSCRFAGPVHFAGSNLGKNAAFNDTRFNGGADFQWAEFGGEVHFDETRFDAATIFAFANLRKATFRRGDLSHCFFSQSRGLDQAEFDQVQWARWPSSTRGIGRREAIADELHARGVRARVALRNLEVPATLESSERVYRALRASYEARKDHPRARQFYVGEMEMRRLSLVGGRLRRTVGSLTGWYWLISEYGERWGRAFGWFGALVIACALLYLVAGLQVKVIGHDDAGVIRTQIVSVSLSDALADPEPVSAILRNLSDTLVHSLYVASFFGRDMYASAAGALGVVVQTIELVLGPLFLGLAGLAVRRQFQR